MNILGIDFEEWYHPELVRPHIKNIKHNENMADVDIDDSINTLNLDIDSKTQNKSRKKPNLF